MEMEEQKLRLTYILKVGNIIITTGNLSVCQARK